MVEGAADRGHASLLLVLAVLLSQTAILIRDAAEGVIVADARTELGRCPCPLLLWERGRGKTTGQ